MLPAFLNSIDGLQGLIFYTIPEDSNTQPLIALREKIAALPNPDLATIELLDRRIRLAREWESNRIRQFILEGKITPLRVSYGRLVIGVLIYSMLIVLLRSVKKNYTSRLLEVTDGIAKSGVMVLFVFLVCMLPVVFGFTIQDNKYQLCEVVVMGNEEAEQPYFLSIIGTSGEYLTVYDRLGGPHLTLYRKSDVARMRCWGAQFIFRNEHFRKQKR